MTNITNLETIEKYLAESLPYGRDGYAQVFFDLSDGEIIVVLHDTANDWTRYRSDDIIDVCNTREPLTADRLTKLVETAVKDHEYYKQVEQEYYKNLRSM